MTLNMRPRSLVLEKKRIVAWHDTVPAYIILALFSLGTVLFSVTGIKVARECPEYSQYAWVPWLLLVMSVVIFIASVSRLLHRMILTLRERDYV